MNAAPLLSIAGHDPTGGAGLQADLAAWQALGLHGTSVCTALTVQDGRGVASVLPTPPETLRAALQAACGGGEPVAVKLGMLGSAEVAAEVAQFCVARSAPVVWDPVLGASAGGSALLQATPELLGALARTATVITPNRIEALRLLNLPAWDGAGALPADWLQALRARWLSAGRTQAVLLKGGHGAGDRSADWLITRDSLHALRVPRLPAGARGAVHGTGCTHASVLAAMLGAGWALADAAAEAQWRTHAAIAAAWSGPAQRPMANAQAALGSASMPELLDAAAAWDLAPQPEFAPLERAPGLYPVLPDVGLVLRALDLGIGTVQLRIKDLEGQALRAAIERAAHAAREAGAQLFINDHWREALDAGAYGVHLGQEDLPRADVQALRAAGLRLGVSTHSVAEMARAHAVRPSYIAMGPVWPTTLKVMPYAPLGLERLRGWAARCKPRYPVVAIGGISLERASAAMACGADGFAVVSALTQAPDFAVALRRGMALAERALEQRAAAAA